MNLQEAVAKKKKPSQHDMLRNHFDKGWKLTTAQAYETYQIMALSQRVGELKRDGYPVTSRIIKTKSGKRVAEYRKI